MARAPARLNPADYGLQPISGKLSDAKPYDFGGGAVAADEEKAPPKKPSSFVSGVKRGAGGVLSSFARTGEDLGLPLRGAREFGEQVVADNPADVVNLGDIAAHPVQFGKETLAELTPQIGVSFGAERVGNVIGGILGAEGGPPGIAAGAYVGGKLAQYVANLGMEYGDIRSTALERGVDDKGRALGAAAGAAALDTIGPVDLIVGRFARKGIKEVASKGWKGYGKAAGLGVAGEGVTEPAQTFLERMGAGQPTADEEARGEYGMAAAKGALGGGVLGVAEHAAAPHAQPQTTPPETPPAPAPAPGEPTDLLTPPAPKRQPRVPPAPVYPAGARPSEVYGPAIAAIESRGSGDYKALGKVITRQDGSEDQALGKYQMMRSNLPRWTRQALGRELTPEEFLANPKAQDRVFDHVFGGYIKKYGSVEDAVNVWFTGRPVGKDTGTPDALGTTPNAYVAKVMAELRKSGTAAGGGGGGGEVDIPTSEPRARAVDEGMVVGDEQAQLAQVGEQLVADKALTPQPDPVAASQTLLADQLRMEEANEKSARNQAEAPAVAAGMSAAERTQRSRILGKILGNANITDLRGDFQDHMKELTFQQTILPEEEAQIRSVERFRRQEAEQAQAEAMAEVGLQAGPMEDTTLGVPGVETAAAPTAQAKPAAQIEPVSTPTPAVQQTITAPEAVAQAHADTLGSSKAKWFMKGARHELGLETLAERNIPKRQKGVSAQKDISTWFREGREFAAKQTGQPVREPEPTPAKQPMVTKRRAQLNARIEAQKAEVAKKAARAETRVAAARERSTAKTTIKAPGKAAQAAKPAAATPATPKVKKAPVVRKSSAEMLKDVMAKQKAKARETAAADQKLRDDFHDRVDKALDKGLVTQQQAVQLRVLVDQQVKPDDPDSAYRFTMKDMEGRFEFAQNERAKVTGGKFAVVSTAAANQPFQTWKEMNAWDKRLKAELAKRGLADIRLFTTSMQAMFDKYGVEGAQGHFEDALEQVNRTIEVAFNAKNPLAVLNHEIVHALRSMGVITEAEWQKLATLAQSDRDLMQWVTEAYPDLTVEEQLEEAIAEKFSDWSQRHSKQAGLPYLQRLMTRIKDWFAGFKASMKGAGFETAEEVMHAIERGVIARRQGDGGRATGSRFMLAGEKSSRKRVGLKTAKEMAQLGVSEDVIWQKTGWIKDVDGKWKYEIDDATASMMAAWDQVDSTQKLKLGDVLKHPDLFEAYPELADVTVTRQPALGDMWRAVQGWFSASTNTINITPYAKDPMSTLIHEVQHAVQHIEGFAVGGSAKQFNLGTQANVDRLRTYYERLAAEETKSPVDTTDLKAVLASLAQKTPAQKLTMLDTLEPHRASITDAMVLISDLQKEVAKIEQEARTDRQGFDAAHTKAVDEWEAREKARNKRHDDEYAQARVENRKQRAETQAAYDAIQDEKKALLASGVRYGSPEFNALQSRSNAAHLAHLATITGSPQRDPAKERAERDADPRPKRDWDAENAHLKALSDKALDLHKQQKVIEKQIEEVVTPYSDLAFDLYQLLSGEVESRDTEARRLGLSSDQKRVTRPGLSQGIKPEERIVTFEVGDQGAASTGKFSVAAMSQPRPGATGPESTARRNEVKRGARALDVSSNELLRKAHLFFADTEDVAKIAAKYMKSAIRFVELHSRGIALARKFQTRLVDIRDVHRSLPAVLRGIGKGSVSRFLYDSVLSKKWGFQPDYKREDGTPYPGMDKAVVDPALAARFEEIKRISPKAAKMIEDVFRFNYDAREQLHRATVGAIDAEYDPIILSDTATDAEKVEAVNAKERALAFHSRVFDTQEGLPYSPLKRQGAWAVVGKSEAYRAAEKANDQKALEKMRGDGDHYFVDFRNTLAGADVLRADVLTKFGKDGTYAFERGQAPTGAVSGREMLMAFTRMKTAMEDEVEQGTKGAKRLQRLATDFYLHTLSEESARKGELHREGVSAENPVTGEALDMMEAFFSRGNATAEFVASIQNNAEMQQTMRDMQKELSQVPPSQQQDAHRLHNELMSRYEHNLSAQPNRLVDKAMRANSWYTLLTSPFYYAQNATQAILISHPALLARYGPSASKEFWNAYGDFMGMTKGIGWLDRVDYTKHPDEKIRDLLKVLAERGRLDSGITVDDRAWLVNGNGVLPQAWNRFDKFTRMMPQRIETMNRVVTGIAAYRAAIAAGKSEAVAQEEASELIRTTHGDYSGFNSPQLFHAFGGIGKIALQFRKFQVIMATHVVTEFRKAFWPGSGASREERLIAMKGLAFLSAHLAAVGGIVGLPGAALLGPLIGTIMNALDDDDDKDWSDWQASLREALGATGGDALADFLYKGAPYALLKMDTSDRLGMGNMLALAPFTGLEEAGTDKQKWYAVMGQLMLGSAGKVVSKGIGGLDYGITQGDWSRMAESIAPGGISTALKAYRIANQGVTDKSGRVLIQPEDIDGIEIAMIAAGVNPKKLADQAEKTSERFSVDAHYSAATTKIKRQYTRAFQAKDASSLQEIRGEWKDLQAARKRDGFTQQPISELLKAPRELAKKQRNIKGGVAYEKSNKAFVMMQMMDMQDAQDAQDADET